MTIEILNESYGRVPKKFLTSLAPKLMKSINAQIKREGGEAVKWTGRSLAVLFVDSPKMISLNRQHRGKKKVTDVLSFESFVPQHLGDLVLCYPLVATQAHQNKPSIRDEMVYLILHGILHLLGYEHEKGGEDERKMFAIQDAVFAKYLDGAFK